MCIECIGSLLYFLLFNKLKMWFKDLFKFRKISENLSISKAIFSVVEEPVKLDPIEFIIPNNESIEVAPYSKFN